MSLRWHGTTAPALDTVTLSAPPPLFRVFLGCALVIENINGRRRLVRKVQPAGGKNVLLFRLV